jgi:FkbM family methyltransferase
MLDFSSISLNSMGGRILRGLLRVIPASVNLRIIQGPIKGKKWIKGSGVNGYWLGSFELDKVRQFVEVLKKDQVVYDIGANVGYYTLLSSLHVGEKGHVYSFEPLPMNIYYLRRHIAMNQLQNVSVVEAAVSDSCDKVYFDEGPNRFMGKISSDGTIEVQTFDLDSLSEQGRIDFPDVMKIDVEGAELSVLRGAKGIIHKSKPLIFLATHESNNPGVHQGCITFLTKLGYEVVSAEQGLDIDETSELIARYCE